MSAGNGGEGEHLAPVIPLFGGPAPEHPAPERPVGVRPARGRRPSLPDPDPDPVVEAAYQAFVTAMEDRNLEPFAPAADAEPADPRGAAPAEPEDAEPVAIDGGSWHPTWSADRRERAVAGGAEASGNVDAAEKALLKKLRTRSLSVSEARAVLREYDLDTSATEHMLAAMADYGYLDDAALADQLVHAGVDRKGHGRQVIAQTLAKRGIPREVAERALAALPDDDLERALEFARAKARSLRDLDRDTALRRLTGQLARRGYGGSVAMTAARTALDEAPAGSGGVRFR